MAVYVSDIDSLSTVTPSALYAYLASKGWQRTEPYGKVGHIYILEGETPELLVPASPAFADYALRLSQILEILSSVEERESRAVLRDLSMADVDLVRVRVPEAMTDGSMPIDRGVTLVRESRNMLLAAACSATRPQRVFRMGSNKKAVQYLKTVRLGQTDQGSFVVNLILPAPRWPRVRGDHWGPRLNEPFETRVMHMLASGLRAVRRGVDSVNRGFGIFEESVQEGVSANLCDALSSLLQDLEALDLSVCWALTRERRDENVQMHFRHSDEKALAEASRILKNRQDRPNQLITGYVTALTRGESAREGHVTIRAMVDNVMRSIGVDFAPDHYGRIVEAHNSRLEIMLQGDLKRDGQKWVLLNPRHLTFVRDAPW